MRIYEVPSTATEELKKNITQLFVQQISIDNEEDSYQLAKNAVHITLDPQSSSRLIIAEENNVILGLAFINIGVSLRVGGTYLWLNELHVHEDYRRKGIGKKLLLFIIHLAEKEGIRSIELETGVNNSVTKHMYNSLGFYEIISSRYGFAF